MLVVGLLVVLGALIVVAAVLAAAEVALLRTPKVALEVAARDGEQRAAVMLRLLDDLPLVLNTVLLAVLLAQVGAAAISGYLAQRWFGGLATSLAAVAVTFGLFVYSEAIPKTLAVRAPLRFGLPLARPVRGLVRTLGLLTRALLKIADAQTPGSGASARTAFSEEELRLLAAESAEAGEIEAADAELVNRSFEFGDTRVAQVLVPRDEIVTVDEGVAPSDALVLAVASGHRRLPVTRGSLDSIAGVVRLRDLARAAQEDAAATAGHLAQPTLVATPDEFVAGLLTRMQRSGLRFAVVVGRDERTEGIVTIEDIVAELVGEIEEPD